ncbi:hypothetical protein NUW58_g6930 [Xylaria curta]|uniref:Uncharacterized protein n=1 Tax=Xylaria curta TaxID=42375 RepID=A0ACC1NQ00_9PEZI|nr:hypothetical protein NUW58_g6930 [Xylaria curta]
MLDELARRRETIVIEQRKCLPLQLEYAGATPETSFNKPAQTLALEKLKALWIEQGRDISEAERKMGRLEADIIRLQKEAVKAYEETITTKVVFWGRVSSLITNDSKDLKARKQRSCNRTYYLKLKKGELSDETQKLSDLRTAIEITEIAIDQLEQEVQVEQWMDQDEGTALTEQRSKQHTKEWLNEANGSSKRVANRNLGDWSQQKDHRLSPLAERVDSYTQRHGDGLPYRALTVF